VVVERPHPHDELTSRVARATASGDARPVPHLAALDGLRGIAILLVVWYHVWEISWLPADVHAGPIVWNFNVFPETGSAGVDLFYFISGFCLFYPYARTLFDGAPRQSIATFAYRRVLKIVPSYYLAIALLTVFGLAQYSGQRDEVAQIVSHLTFTQNLWDGTWSGIDGVMWSLATEVQFYVLFPAICWCAMRKPLGTFAALFVTANLYRFAFAHAANVNHMVDRLPGAIDLFAAGIFAAWAYRFIAVRRPALAAKRALWTAVAGAVALACYALLAYEFAHRYDTGWNVGWKVTFRPAFDLLLLPLTLGSLFAFPLWQRALANRALVFLSVISYNVYLWHQPIAKLLAARRWTPLWGTDLHSDTGWALWYSLAAFAASIAVAWAISTYFEQPLLRRKPFSRRIAERRLSRSPAGNAP
jgi:peptidoglycan/LPS O-acetylase OafA/YrhL